MIRLSSCSARSSAALALLVLPAMAQQHQPSRPGLAEPASITQNLANKFRERDGTLLEQDGVLWGMGHRYKARFLDQAVEFVPALGENAPHNMPVTLQLETVGRGSEATTVSTALRSHRDQRVTYRHRQVLEHYDVVAAGIEQSFEFARLPAGRGDLIVRCTMTTELAVTPDGDGLRLELEGVGGLRIGGVTAIDAHGRRAAGSIHYEHGYLELAVPAAFVDTAALPLVVDPLIGAIFSTNAVDDDDRNPDVAYDVTNDVYLVVFERVYSATDLDVHGQRVSATGSLVGTRIYIENSGATSEYDAQVANVNVRDKFVVVYQQGADIKCKTVEAATANIGTELVVASGPDVHFYADVGGEATTADDDAVCVWWNTTQQTIMAAQIQLAANGTENVFDVTTIYDISTLPPGTPRISKGGGDTGRHAIAFATNIAGSTHIMAMLVDRNLTILDSGTPVITSPGDQFSPEVDGDGRHWVVAWAADEAANNLSHDIYCRSMSFDGTEPVGNQLANSSSAMPVTVDVSDNEYSPTVIWTGGSTLIGWHDDDGTVTNTYFKSLDPFTCLTCEQSFQYTLSLNSGTDYHLEGCSKLSGGGSDSDALLVWENIDTTADPDIVAQQWSSADGNVTNLGGGCGQQAGAGYATCARNGNATFSVRLLSELPDVPAILIFSRDYSGLPCNTCQLIPDPYTGWISPHTTNGYGTTSFDAAIPSGSALIGVSFYVQWLVSEPVTPGCYLFASDMTDGFRVTIE